MEHTNYYLCLNPECDFSMPQSKQTTHSQFCHICGEDLLFVGYNYENNNFEISTQSFFSLCSNPECDFSVPQSNYSKFCHTCESDLLFVCPHCNKYYFETNNQIFCGSCGKRIK